MTRSARSMTRPLPPEAEGEAAGGVAIPVETTEERPLRFLVAIPVSAVATILVLALVMAQVAPPASYPEWKVAAYQWAQDDIDVVIIGSSRVQSAGTQAFEAYGAGRGWNLFIPELTLDDSVALLRWMEREGTMPSVVIVALEPGELIRLRHTALNTAPVREEVFGEPAPPLTKAEHLARGLSKEAWVDAAFLAYAAIFTDASVRSIHLEDGSLEFIPPPDPEGEIREYLETVQVPVYDNATRKVIPEQVALLDEAVAIAQRNAARLVLVVPPSHPTAVDRIQDTPGWTRAVAAMHERAPAWCATGHVALYDLSDPRTFGDDGSTFRDGMHFGSQTAEAMMLAMRDPARDACAPHPGPPRSGILHDATDELISR